MSYPEFEPSRADEARDVRDPRGVRDPHWAGLDELVTRAEEIRREMARLHAERAEVCAEALEMVADRVAQRQAARVAHRGQLGDDIPLREMVAELGAAMRVGDQTVRSWLAVGAALVHQYPNTLAALRSGEIDERHASAIIDGGAAIVDDDLREQYEQQVLRAAETETAASLRGIARAIAGRLQSDLVDDRHRRAHERRRVRLYELEDGLSRLVADLPAALGHAIFDRVSELARAVEGVSDDSVGEAADDTPSDGDDRCLDERRADVLCDLLLAARPTAHDGLDEIRGTVHVTVPVLTLAGLDDEPALLAGHGPIDADTARRIAAAAPVWERVLTHPHTGEPLACDRYRPSAELRRYLTARDEHCRWVGCRRTARRCDADHTVAFSDGGETSAANLSLLCRRHHRLKHASPWTVRHRGGGGLEFTSPTGRTYRNDAPPVVSFVSHLDRWRAPYDPGDPAPF